jgi:hypothetical protein
VQVAELTTPERPFARREPAALSEVTPLPPPPAIEPELPRAPAVVAAPVAAIESLPAPLPPPTWTARVGHVVRASWPWSAIVAVFVAGGAIGFFVGQSTHTGATGSPIVVRVPVALPAPAPAAVAAEPKPPAATAKPQPVAAKPQPVAAKPQPARRPIAKAPPPRPRPAAAKPHAKCEDLSCL